MGIFSGGEKGKSLKASTVEKSVHSRPWGDERIMSGKMVAGEDWGWYLQMGQSSRSLGNFPRDREKEREEERERRKRKDYSV